MRFFWQRDGSEGAKRYKEKITQEGLAIEVDLSALVERVYVSPTAAPWFTSLVMALTTKSGFAFPVHQSALSASPLY